MRQITLLPQKKYSRRKIARAISLRGANHVVFKSARPILRRKRVIVRECIVRTQRRFGAQLKAIAVMEDHVHLIIKVESRTQFANTLRMLAGMIALKAVHGKLWVKRAWSRPLKWGHDLSMAMRYVARNSIKARCFDLNDTFLLIDGQLQT